MGRRASRANSAWTARRVRGGVGGIAGGGNGACDRHAVAGDSCGVPQPERRWHDARSAHRCCHAAGGVADRCGPPAALAIHERPCRRSDLAGPIAAKRGGL